MYLSGRGRDGRARTARFFLIARSGTDVHHGLNMGESYLLIHNGKGSHSFQRLYQTVPYAAEPGISSAWAQRSSKAGATLPMPSSRVTATNGLAVR
jgi:hypothetical protein